MNPALNKLIKNNIRFLIGRIALNIWNVMQRPGSWTILHFLPSDLQLRDATLARRDHFVNFIRQIRPRNSTRPQWLECVN
jgi:hypothetical protein